MTRAAPMVYIGQAGPYGLKMSSSGFRRQPRRRAVREWVLASGGQGDLNRISVGAGVLLFAKIIMANRERLQSIPGLFHRPYFERVAHAADLFGRGQSGRAGLSMIDRFPVHTVQALHVVRRTEEHPDFRTRPLRQPGLPC